MQPTWWNDFVHMVHDLVGAMGPTPFTVLIVVLLILGLGGVFGFGYMVLHFGDKAAEMFFPFVKDCFAALAKESTKNTPP